MWQNSNKYYHYKWCEQGLPSIRVAVNLSGFQLERRDFVERIKAILEETGTEGQREFLKNENCNEMQGHLFSKPVTADKIAKLLASEK